VLRKKPSLSGLVHEAVFVVLAARTQDGHS